MMEWLMGLGIVAFCYLTPVVVCRLVFGSWPWEERWR